MPRMQQRRDTGANWTATNPILAAGEIGVETDTTPQRFKIGNGSAAWSALAYTGTVSSVAGRTGVITLSSGDISNTVASPAQLTADQNNYALESGDILRVSASAARNITGLVATVNGDARLLVNIGTFDITLKHQSASSTAANRFICAGASDYVLSPGASAPVVYDATSAGWRVG
jgi:hypothetical protein